MSKQTSKKVSTKSRQVRSKKKVAAHAKVARHVRSYWHFHLSGLAIIALAATLFMGIVGRSDHTAALPPTPSGKEWKQIWSDEFNGGLDTSKWNVQNNSNFGAANHEDQCYRAANVSVSGGALQLTGKRETVSCGATNPNTGNSTYYFTSGMVTTRAQGGPMKFKFRQGYIEARIKAPKGNLYWPAFWLVGPGDGSTPGWPDYGEFDITEMYGTRPDATFGTMHYACPNKASCMTAANVYNMKTGSSYGGVSNFGTQMNDQATFDSYSGGMLNYNTFGLLWEANRITWYVNGKAVRYFDGNEVRRYESNGSTTLENKVCTTAMGCPSIPFSTVFDYEKSIILNMALGGDGITYPTHGYTGYDTASGYVNGNLVADLPGALEVDYVRVYQLANTPTQTPPPPSTPSTPPPTTTPPPTADNSSSGGASNPIQNSGASAPVVTSTTGEKVVVPKADEATVEGKVVLDPVVATDKAVQARIEKVAFYVDGTLIATQTAPPFTLDTTKVADGKHTILQKTFYKDGRVEDLKRVVFVNNQLDTNRATNVLGAAKVISMVGLAIVGLIVLYLLYGSRLPFLKR